LLNYTDIYFPVGFFVAFLSWFAFPPLIPEAIKADLKLTTAEVANSSILALTATVFVRFVVGPLIDRYGPRKVMASLLVLGAIPSGLAGTAHSASTLYALRFFIGILGATFVPCQAWTSIFFDKNCVGTANALVGGWGRFSLFCYIVVYQGSFLLYILGNMGFVNFRPC
jgi:NNP family nitrate/nitrite transporter-like MFS transporter